MFLLIAVAMMATGFTGYYAGARGSRGRVATFIVSLTIAAVPPCAAVMPRKLWRK
jgi:hypothetical protein